MVGNLNEMIKINIRYYNQKEYVEDALNNTKKDIKKKLYLINEYINIKKIENLLDRL